MNISDKRAMSQKIEGERAFGGGVAERRKISALPASDETGSKRGHATISNCYFRRSLGVALRRHVSSRLV
ncbi:hypothetical protein CWO90_37555 [Bradyrhizobium sp. Leo121]|nr:hypothetical protein CWO90_37555 [Bradyrhizobium sp. Leo121]